MIHILLAIPTFTGGMQRRILHFSIPPRCLCIPKPVYFCIGDKRLFELDSIVCFAPGQTFAMSARHQKILFAQINLDPILCRMHACIETTRNNNRATYQHLKFQFLTLLLLLSKEDPCVSLLFACIVVLFFCCILFIYIHVDFVFRFDWFRFSIACLRNG